MIRDDALCITSSNTRKNCGLLWVTKFGCLRHRSVLPLTDCTTYLIFIWLYEIAVKWVFQQLYIVAAWSVEGQAGPRQLKQLHTAPQGHVSASSGAFLTRQKQTPSGFSSQKDNSMFSKQSRVVSSGKTQIHLHAFKFLYRVTRRLLNQVEKRLGNPHKPSLQTPARSVEIIPQEENTTTRVASPQHLQINPSTSSRARQPDTN